LEHIPHGYEQTAVLITGSTHVYMICEIIVNKKKKQGKHGVGFILENGVKRRLPCSKMATQRGHE
jgi:hypothetical protein